MPKTLIVSHDAGGAYLLSKWCRDYTNKCDFSYCLQGPAIDIFKSELVDICFSNTIDWEGVEQVITSTGWQTSFEIKVIKLAKSYGIYVCAYLDHWANYKKRFMHNNELFLPDEIWCADQDALIIAKQDFMPYTLKFR